MEDSIRDSVSEKRNEIRELQISDYIRLIFDVFLEMHGDRKSGDDESIIGGLARLNGHKVIVIGHQSNRASGELMRTSPAGYRKGSRLINLAKDFNKPVIVFIGALNSPSSATLEQQVNESIARYVEQMSSLTTPSIGVIMSGIGGTSVFEMYPVDRAILIEDAKDISSYPNTQELSGLNMIHNIVNISLDDSSENISGKLKKAILEELEELTKIKPEILVEQRLNRLQNQICNFHI